MEITSLLLYGTPGENHVCGVSDPVRLKSACLAIGTCYNNEHVWQTKLWLHLTCADPEGDGEQGVRTHLENHESI